MTQFSFPWGCDALGDGGPNSFSLDIVVDMNMFLNNADPTIYGVIPWGASPYAGLLAATNPGGDTVRIASGVGMVEGWLYTNDANVDFDVSGGAANATDLIVLRRSNPGAAPQTVRLALVRGPAAGIATVTQTTGVFEIALWEVELDAGGSFSALNDVREYVHTPLMIATDNIDDGAVTAAKLATRLFRVEMPMVALSAVPDALGMKFADAAVRDMVGMLTVPDNFVSDGELYIVGMSPTGNGVKVAYINMSVDYGTDGEAYNVHTSSGTGLFKPLAANQLRTYETNFFALVSVANLGAGDTLVFWFERDGTDLLDDLNDDLYLRSVYLEYQGK